MRRADSVKQLGTAVLDSRVTAVTAVALDRALTRADKYVDKYLPPDQQDAADGNISIYFFFYIWKGLQNVCISLALKLSES